MLWFSFALRLEFLSWNSSVWLARCKLIDFDWFSKNCIDKATLTDNITHVLHNPLTDSFDALLSNFSTWLTHSLGQFDAHLRISFQVHVILCKFDAIVKLIIYNFLSLFSMILKCFGVFLHAKEFWNNLFMSFIRILMCFDVFWRI